MLTGDERDELLSSNIPLRPSFSPGSHKHRVPFRCTFLLFEMNSSLVSFEDSPAAHGSEYSKKDTYDSLPQFRAGLDCLHQYTLHPCLSLYFGTEFRVDPLRIVSRNGNFDAFCGFCRGHGHWWTSEVEDRDHVRC